MKENTTIENIIELLKNLVYKLAKPIYLKSIGCKDLDEYISELMMVEIVYSDGRFLKDVLKNYYQRSDWYFKENPSEKEKFDKFLLAFEEFKSTH